MKITLRKIITSQAGQSSSMGQKVAFSHFITPIRKLTMFLDTVSQSFVVFCLVLFLRQDLKALTRLALNSQLSACWPAATLKVCATSLAHSCHL